MQNASKEPLEENSRIQNLENKIKELEQARIDALNREKMASSVLELLQKTSKAITSEIELEKLVQRITDKSTELSGAQFGAFFYNVINPQGELYTLYTISGVPREEFSKFPMPRNTKIFAPTFGGEKIVRYDDVTKEKNYGQNPPYHGMPKGHLPVKSYMAVPVISPINNEVIGGLFFGHSEPGIFNETTERIVQGIAVQGAIAMGNAKLFEEKRKISAALLSNEQQSKLLLETKVKERTAELEKINFELLQFTSVVSHDLKEPLRKISIFSNRLHERIEKENAEEQKYLQNIIDSSTRMTILIDDLLSFSRLSKPSSKFQLVDLNEVIKQVLRDFEITIQETKTNVKINGLPQVEGISLQLGQVFQNLISNAIKFRSHDREPLIEISSTEENEYYLITFSDNGIGFRNEFSEKIFDIFQRLHTNETHEGTGIGLAIVKKIIHLHNGTIRAESSEDKGTKFFILLPKPKLNLNKGIETN